MRRLGPLLALLGWLSPAAAQFEFPVTTNTLDLRFSDSGALVSAAACYPRCFPAAGGEAVRRVEYGGDGAAVVRGDLPSDAWAMTPGMQGATTVLEFESPGGALLTWRIPRDGYVLELEVAGEGDMPQHLAVRSGPRFRPRPLAGFGNWLEQIGYVALPGRSAGFEVERGGLDEDTAPVWLTDGWAGFRNRYWALMLRADKALDYRTQTGQGRRDAAIDVDLAGQSQLFQIYIGPVEPAELAAADPALRGLMYGALWFWLRWICFALLWLLSGIHAGVSVLAPASLAWGLSIMLLSLAVHILMRPLTHLADRLQDQVHATESRLAPDLARIRREHKGEQQAEEIIALYKRAGVHPLYSLRSLIGVAIVIPVFIGAFDMLAENIHLLGTGFLWIGDLSRPDAIAALPFELPFFGAGLNLLPFLMTGLSVLASWLHRPPAQHPSLRVKQVRNMLLLALAFFVLFYTFPAGMVLYWATNNLISAVRGGWQHRRVGQAASTESEP